MTYEQYLQRYGMRRGEYDPDTLLSGLEQEFGIEGLLSAGQMPYLTETMIDAGGVTPYSKELQFGTEALLDSLMPRYNVPKKVHGNLAGTYATDVYGKKVKADFTTGSAKILGQVQGKQSESKKYIDDLFKQAYMNAASLAG
jgi:hypothetical protein|tara:strand:+ start:174 stop:599 length:426 start_codon:yes stop_codon:yes gene_type:complete